MVGYSCKALTFGTSSEDEESHRMALMLGTRFTKVLYLHIYNRKLWIGGVRNCNGLSCIFMFSCVFFVVVFQNTNFSFKKLW